ncbi:cytochrome P450 [Jiangella rhizosphaerae]|uniref:Cytochrome P450 n=1 Tax=Jiangella rhizosphaerae TaxID=2293569 RepID=A0A418KQ14_9ACTN|nr:cytochrome P450 [Jiangella rhizosphaerae]RIQ22048.1 cytochrome P450 [Jiangella rhizosphaerae]
MRRPLPVVGDLLAFQSDRLRFVTSAHRDQGDVARFRLGPFPVWQLAHPDHVRSVLVTDAAAFRKGMVLQRARVVLGDGLLTAEGDVHRHHRDLVQPAFHSRRIAGYASVMIDRAVAVSSSWPAREPLDVHAATVRMTLETAGTTLLGASVDVGAVEGALADLLSAYKLAFLPFSEKLQGLPVGPLRRLQRGRKRLHGLVDSVVAERTSSGHDGGDLLSALVPGPDRGGRLSPEELRDEATTLLLAGHETTANTLAFALHLLAAHPSVQTSVQDEVDAVGVPGPSDADRLPLCRAVVSEALRLYPPSWMMGRQALSEYPVGGHVIQPGDLVVLPQWVVHHDPRWWPQPFSFDPGRWLDGGGATGRERPRWAFFPFGAGLRRCIGEGFAWTEAVLGLAAIVARWRLRPVPGWPLRLDPLITLRPRGGLWLIPEPR